MKNPSTISSGESDVIVPRVASEATLRPFYEHPIAAIASPAPSVGEPAKVSLAPSRVGWVYLAGPMTGYDDYNFPLFNRTAASLRAEGFNVINPAEHGIVEGAEWADYLRFDLAKIAGCESIALLPGWEASKGARLEVHVAQALGMSVRCLDGATPPAAPAAPSVGEPVTDPLQGAADWLKMGLVDVTVADIQSRLLIGYNRARRLSDGATPPAAPAATEAPSKPFGYYIHIAAEQRGEFVHDLDEALDDLTNCECKITELFDHAIPAPAVGASLTELREAFRPVDPHAWPWTKEQSRNYPQKAADIINAAIRLLSVGASVQPVPEGLSDEPVRLALDALEEIALAGMSGTGQESEEGMQAWHARRAWEFIGIAARARDEIRAALAPTKGGEAS